MGDRLLITRGHRCQNVQNWVEYSRRRWQIQQDLKANKGLLRSIDNLKTAGVLPNEAQYQLEVGAHEQFLFHGTNDTAAECITKGDFLVNLAGSNAGTLYGRGVYLAASGAFSSAGQPSVMSTTMTRLLQTWMLW